MAFNKLTVRGRRKIYMETMHPDLPRVSRNEKKLLMLVHKRELAGEDTSSESLANALGTTPNTIDRLIMSLDRKGLVSIEFTLAPKGRAVANYVTETLQRYFSSN